MGVSGGDDLHSPLPAMRSTVLGILAAATTVTGLISASTPASAQLYSNYGRRPSYSVTPSQSNIRYNVYQARPSSGMGYGNYGNSQRNSSRGYGHSSGSYFGW